MRIGYFIGLLAAGLLASSAYAEMPRNVQCAIKAQQAARSVGLEYKKVYNRTFELCMLRSPLPQERQTAHLIEKPQPYVAISSGFAKTPKLTAEKLTAEMRIEKPTGTRVRLSPHVWVLNEGP